MAKRMNWRRVELDSKIRRNGSEPIIDPPVRRFYTPPLKAARQKK